MILGHFANVTPLPRHIQNTAQNPETRIDRCHFHALGLPMTRKLCRSLRGNSIQPKVGKGLVLITTVMVPHSGTRITLQQ